VRNIVVAIVKLSFALVIVHLLTQIVVRLDPEWQQQRKFEMSKELLRELSK